MNNRKMMSTIVLLACGVGALPLGQMLRAQTAPQAPPNPTAPAAAEPAASGALPFTEVPFYADWASSPHARRSAEPFNHWNHDGVIPVECAKCHSTPGFRDFLGADGSKPGVVDHPAPIGTVITCVACHNDKTVGLTSVTFPSGERVTNVGANAICMTCHQGVESTNSVNTAVANIGDDTVEPKLEFINVHYTAAGAMLYGMQAKVGYEYAGKVYAGRFPHQEPYTQCTTCHELHTVAVKYTACQACHRQVTDEASLRKIRVSRADYDGTADANEGLAQEIDHQRDRLLAAIMVYAKQVSGKPVVYNLEAYPYFFVDTNGNGIADKDEIKFPNRYKSWTPRLLKAAYNYQFVIKDPGAYAHNPVYALELLYDSIADLGGKITVDLGGAKRP
jgi:Cytochrome c7 and related cytochrome c